LPIIILVEFRDYVAILSGLVGILATFTGIMWMLVQQINKRIDAVEKGRGLMQWKRELMN
jgi:ABC-type polysaccharide/polyol phosphate export permease